MRGDGGGMVSSGFVFRDKSSKKWFGFSRGIPKICVWRDR